MSPGTTLSKPWLNLVYGLAARQTRASRNFSANKHKLRCQFHGWRFKRCTTIETKNLLVSSGHINIRMNVRVSKVDLLLTCCTTYTGYLPVVQLIRLPLEADGCETVGPGRHRPRNAAIMFDFNNNIGYEGKTRTLTNSLLTLSLIAAGF